MPLNIAIMGDKLGSIGTKLAQMGKALHDQVPPLRDVAKVLGDGDTGRSLTVIATGIRSVRSLLEGPTNAFRSVGTNLKAISIPALVTDSQTIELPLLGRISVITEVRISSTRPLVATGNEFESVATHLSNIRAALATIAGAMDEVKHSLGSIRVSVTQAADSVQSAGDSASAAGIEMQALGALL